MITNKVFMKHYQKIQEVNNLLTLDLHKNKKINLLKMNLKILQMLLMLLRKLQTVPITKIEF